MTASSTTQPNRAKTGGNRGAAANGGPTGAPPKVGLLQEAKNNRKTGLYAQGGSNNNNNNNVKSRQRLPSRPQPQQQRQQQQFTSKKISQAFTPTRNNRSLRGKAAQSRSLPRKPNPVKQHVVRITVLGLAGITVDRSKCRDTSTRTKATDTAPAPPTKMRAVVAFSRNSALRGTTCLSKPLARSPNDDAILSEESGRSGTPDWTEPQRHVAVWASEGGGLGSVVQFEANLHERFTQGQSRASFAPKSFEMTIALAEDEDDTQKVALPFGVTTLAISGNECQNGRSVKLDLPILSLAQARPLTSNHKNGLGGYPMIAIERKTENDGDDQGSNNNENGHPNTPDKKKGNGLTRLFKKRQMAAREKAPSLEARTAFSEAYKMDAGGDAIIRVALEVYEKDSELEKHFVAKHARDTGSESMTKSSGSQLSNKTKKSKSKPTSPTESAVLPGRRAGKDLPYDERNAKRRGADPAPSDESTSSSFDQSTQYSGSYETEDTGTEGGTVYTDYTDDRTAATGDDDGTARDSRGVPFDEDEEFYDDDDDYDGEESYVNVEGSTVAFFAWNAGSGRATAAAEEGNYEAPHDTDDEYTLSFEEKKRTKRNGGGKGGTESEEEPSIDIDLFGRKFRIPTCASLPIHMEGADGETEEDGSILTMSTKQEGTVGGGGMPSGKNKKNKKGIEKLIGDIRDDMTYVTADFFGKSYAVPICSGLVNKDDDDTDLDTITTNNDTLGRQGQQMRQFADQVCGSPDGCGKRGDVVSKDTMFTMTRTFSTLSDHSKQVVAAEIRATTVRDFLKKDAKNLKANTWDETAEDPIGTRKIGSEINSADDNDAEKDGNGSTGTKPKEMTGSIAHSLTVDDVIEEGVEQSISTMTPKKAVSISTPRSGDGNGEDESITDILDSSKAEDDGQLISERSPKSVKDFAFINNGKTRVAISMHENKPQGSPIGKSGYHEDHDEKKDDSGEVQEPRKLVRKLSDMFQCQTADTTTMDKGLDYDMPVGSVPPVVVQDSENISVGDLTASSSFGPHFTSEAKMLEEARRLANEQEGTRRSQRNRGGGGGRVSSGIPRMTSSPHLSL